MRIAQLANFVGPTSGGMKHAVHALGAGYADAGVERLLVVPGSRDSRERTAHGEVVTLRAPRVGGGYRLIVEPWRVIDALDTFGPTSVEVSDKSTLTRRNPAMGTPSLSKSKTCAVPIHRRGASGPCSGVTSAPQSRT